jgi:nitronate monooxygenase
MIGQGLGPHPGTSTGNRPSPDISPRVLGISLGRPQRAQQFRQLPVISAHQPHGEMRPLRGSQQLEPAPAKLPDSRKVDRPDGILAGVTELPAAFTEMVGCRLPVQLAPMGGGVGGPELAVAVCRAGGLGMLSASHPMPVADQLRQVRAQTAAPVGVGFFTFDLPARMADLETAASLARVVDLFWGDPDAAVVERIHAGGALAFWQVGSCEEATAAADAGCDAVVAQGVEAGGHVRGTTPLLELLEQVVARAPVPVVAAGGIAAADRVRHVFAAGASAVRVGTRLLATRESAAHPDYLRALLAASGRDTELTTAFGVGWEDAPHRVLRVALHAAATAPDPVAHAAFLGQEWDVPRYATQPPSTSCSGHVAAMAMYAGTGVEHITAVSSAAEVIEQLLSW